MKRNRIWKTLTLVLLLLTLATGLCAAKFIPDDDGNWVQYYYQDDSHIFYIDTNAIKAREFEGKKYLDVSVRLKWKHVEQLILVNRWVESTYAKFHMLIDIENQKWTPLEWANEYAKTKKGSCAVSTIKDGAVLDQVWQQNMLAWVEQNYPSVMQEIRTFNGSKVGAGTQTVTANGDYGFVQTLGDGPVQYAPRSLHRPPTYPVPLDNVMRYYVSAVPASGIIARSGRKLPPTTLSSNQLYIIYDSRTYSDFSSNNIHAVFSYDDATNTFTLYGRDSDDSKDDYVLGALTKIRIISKDDVEYTVEGINLNFEPHPVDDPLTLHLKYVKALPGHKSDGDGYVWNNWDIEKNMSAPIPEIQVDGENYGTMLTDADGANAVEVVYAWGGWNDYDELGLDGLFAFLARKGKVGYAPATGPSAEYFW